MRGMEFLEKMAFADPRYVEAADGQPTKKTRGWGRYAALAAGLAIIVFAGTRWFPAVVENELPMLTVSGNGNGGMGFEGHMAYDITELVNANPWTEDVEITHLPVYKNLVRFDERYNVMDADADRMREFLLDVAERLGADADTLTITDDAPDEEERRRIEEKYAAIGEDVPPDSFEPTRVIAETDGWKISVDRLICAAVTFDPMVELPEGYSFTFYSTYEEFREVAEYLMEEYRDFIGFDDPQIDIGDGSRDIYTRQKYSLQFFENGNDIIEKIVNYNFNWVSFSGSEESGLWLARVDRTDLSEKVGDYPIITADEARKLLLNGNYITTVPYDITDAGDIAKVELIYRTGRHEEYYMPYYRFYVEIPGNTFSIENGMKNYGVYYVPAVEGEYLENMPVWDGRFN